MFTVVFRPNTGAVITSGYVVYEKYCDQYILVSSPKPHHVNPYKFKMKIQFPEDNPNNLDTGLFPITVDNHVCYAFVEYVPYLSKEDGTVVHQLRLGTKVESITNDVPNELLKRNGQIFLYDKHSWSDATEIS